MIEENYQTTRAASRNFGSLIDLQSYELHKEDQRLASFLDNGWDNPFLNAEELARLGFYFYKKPDGVKCYFCYVKLGDFEEGDSALSEHLKWSPNCPLLKRRTTENLPIDSSLLNEILPPLNYDVCGFTKRRRKSKIEERIKYPEYKLLSKRLKTFETWPVGIKQKPQELAEAGFFYSGHSDLTICFSCDLHLSKWEREDNAWIEHKKHAKDDCDFLKLNQETVKLNEQKYEEVKELAEKADISDSRERKSEEKEIPFESVCKICLERKSSILFLPCKHVAVCGVCVFGIENVCPICRTQIEETINLFYA